MKEVFCENLSQLPEQPKVKKYLDREQIATAMNHLLIERGIYQEIDPEKVVEVPSDGCDGHLGLGPWKTWCARFGEFLLIAIDGDGENPTITIS